MERDHTADKTEPCKEREVWRYHDILQYVLDYLQWQIGKRSGSHIDDLGGFLSIVCRMLQ